MKTLMKYQKTCTFFLLQNMHVNLTIYIDERWREYIGDLWDHVLILMIQYLNRWGKKQHLYHRYRTSLSCELSYTSTPLWQLEMRPMRLSEASGRRTTAADTEVKMYGRSTFRASITIGGKKTRIAVEEREIKRAKEAGVSPDARSSQLRRAVPFFY